MKLPCSSTSSFFVNAFLRRFDYLKKAFPDVKFIFSDMRDLSREKAHDVLTNKIQDVPEAARL